MARISHQFAVTASSQVFSNTSSGPRLVWDCLADPNAPNDIDLPLITHAHERADHGKAELVMLTLSVSRYSPCERPRACWLENGPGLNARGGKLRISVRALGSAGDDAPPRAVRRILDDGYVQYLFFDEDEVETAVPESDRSQGDLSETDLSETDEDTETEEGTETEDETIEEEQRADTLNAFTVKKLKKICKEHGVKGYSNLRKGDIIKLIRANVSVQDL